MTNDWTAWLANMATLGTLAREQALSDLESFTPAEPPVPYEMTEACAAAKSDRYAACGGSR